MGNKPSPNERNTVAQLRAAATAIRGVKATLGALVNSLHQTPTTYTSRVKITNALDGANNKLNIAALAFDHEADVLAITLGITDVN